MKQKVLKYLSTNPVYMFDILFETSDNACYLEIENLLKKHDLNASSKDLLHSIGESKGYSGTKYVIEYEGYSTRSISNIIDSLSKFDNYAIHLLEINLKEKEVTAYNHKKGNMKVIELKGQTLIDTSTYSAFEEEVYKADYDFPDMDYKTAYDIINELNVPITVSSFIHILMIIDTINKKLPSYLPFEALKQFTTLMDNLDANYTYQDIVNQHNLTYLDNVLLKDVTLTLYDRETTSVMHEDDLEFFLHNNKLYDIINALTIDKIEIKRPYLTIYEYYTLLNNDYDTLIYLEGPHQFIINDKQSDKIVDRSIELRHAPICDIGFEAIIAN